MARNSVPDFPGLFVEIERNIPIAGLPPAIPCPFCGSSGINLEFQERPHADSAYYAHTSCYKCGAETRGGVGGHTIYQAAQAAARVWNNRHGSTAAPLGRRRRT